MDSIEIQKLNVVRLSMKVLWNFYESSNFKRLDQRSNAKLQTLNFKPSNQKVYRISTSTVSEKEFQNFQIQFWRRQALRKDAEVKVSNRSHRLVQEPFGRVAIRNLRICREKNPCGIFRRNRKALAMFWIFGRLQTLKFQLRSSGFEVSTVWSSDVSEEASSSGASWRSALRKISSIQHFWGATDVPIGCAGWMCRLWPDLLSEFEDFQETVKRSRSSQKNRELQKNFSEKVRPKLYVISMPPSTKLPLGAAVDCHPTNCFRSDCWITSSFFDTSRALPSSLEFLSIRRNLFEFLRISLGSIELRWIWFHWVSIEFDQVSLNFIGFH